MTVCYSSFWLRRYPVSFHSLEFRTLTQKQTQQTKAQGSGCSQCNVAEAHTRFGCDFTSCDIEVLVIEILFLMTCLDFDLRHVAFVHAPRTELEKVATQECFREEAGHVDLSANKLDTDLCSEGLRIKKKQLPPARPAEAAQAARGRPGAPKVGRGDRPLHKAL